MADGEVKIDTKLDTNGLDKGIKDMKNKLNDAGKQADAAAKKNKGLTDSLKNLNAGTVATAASLTGAAVAIKKTVDALNDCAAAYRVQKNAEEALQIAAKNNPYLNDESVYNLRNFASELQSLSEIGDEVSLQVMSQLAATGRNEEQIMQIMSAAADMAAVTGQDLASAAQQLNATLNGNAGALGRQIGAINNLTKEELENGRAIELVAKQYKGVAAATADVEVQLSNAWGDFKENIGRGWQNVTQPVKQFFLDVLSNINEINSKTNVLKDATSERENGLHTAANTKILLDAAREQLEVLNKERDSVKLLLNDTEALRKKTAEMHGYYSNAEAQRQYDLLTKQITQQTGEVSKLVIEYGKLSSAEQKAAEEEAALIAEQKKLEAQAEKDAEAVDVINKNAEALAKRVGQMRLQAEVTGEAIDEQELYNTMLQSYIDLVTTSDQVTANNSAAKERLKLLEQQKEKAKQYREELEKAADAERDAEKTERERKELQEEIQELLYGEVDARLQLLRDIEAYNADEIISEKEKADAIKKIRDELDADEKRRREEEKQAQREKVDATISEYTGYAKQVNDIVSGIADVSLTILKNQTTAELTELEKRHLQGEIETEEYNQKKSELEKKAAREEYKIKMWQWTASMLSAAANIAEGVSKALTMLPPASFINAALVSAAGGVQLAALAANKPVPPSFYTGGVVGGMRGATMGGDNTYIHARAGEMILNANQQRNLWDMINGQQGRGGYILTVNNTQSGRVDTDIRQDTNGGLIVEIIDKHINKGFADGTFDGGMAAMQMRQQGVTIL
ncbi:MAG: hypothetical protein MJ168_12420 [Clostridia bacterium]|nr:hypothetical protein [Clostridia bacterium]